MAGYAGSSPWAAPSRVSFVAEALKKRREAEAAAQQQAAATQAAQVAAASYSYAPSAGELPSVSGLSSYDSQRQAIMNDYDNAMAGSYTMLPYEREMLANSLRGLNDRGGQIRSMIDGSYGAAQADNRAIAANLAGLAGIAGQRAGAGYLGAARAIGADARAGADAVGAPLDGRAAAAVQNARALANAENQLARLQMIGAANEMAKNNNAWYGLGGESSAQRQELALQRELLAAQAEQDTNKMMADRIAADRQVQSSLMASRLDDLSRIQAQSPARASLAGTQLAEAQNRLAKANILQANPDINQYMGTITALGEMYKAGSLGYDELVTRLQEAQQPFAENGTLAALAEAGIQYRPSEFVAAIAGR